MYRPFVKGLCRFLKLNCNKLFFTLLLSFGLDLDLQAFKLMRLTTIINKFVLLSFTIMMH
jgi:hypothetical protein